MAKFGNDLVVVNLLWTDLKTVSVNKKLRLQYDEDSEAYIVFAADYPSVYTAKLYKGTVPESVVDGGYSQATNDSDKTDFTTNYQTPADTTPADSDEEPTFVACASAVSLGSNKSLISVVNASSSTVVVRLRELYLINTQTTAITGAVSTFQLLRLTGHSAGTSVTPQRHDTNDNLNSSVTVRTGATVSGEASSYLRRWLYSTDEWVAGTLDVDAHDHTFNSVLPLFSVDDRMKPIVLRAGQGFTLKCISGTGTFDVVAVFTQAWS